MAIAVTPDGYVYGMKNDGTIKRSPVDTWLLEAGEGDAGSDNSWVALCARIQVDTYMRYATMEL